MHPISLSYTPAALNAAGLASAVTYADGGYALSASSAADRLAHIITVLGNAATDHSGKTFTITGTDSNGLGQTETIAGPNGVATVSTTKYFLTVTSVTASATTGADTFDVGWTAAAVSPTFPLNWKRSQFQVSLGLVITGTINVTVQHTFDGLHGEYVAEPLWFSHSSLSSKTTSADGNYAYPVTGTRLLVNSVSTGATIDFKIVQNTL